jgi:hypothetical protein
MSNYPTFKARLVMGSLFDIRTKDHEGKPILEENKKNWFVGFAVPKGPEWDVVYNTMYQVAASDPACTEALCSQPGFNWKFEDCDAPENPENKGKELYPAGHMLIKFSRYQAMGPIPVFDGAFNPIINKTAVKRGDYFYINASTKFNGAKTVKTNAGMYQNINMVLFAEAGEAMTESATVDPRAAFAGVQGGIVANGGVSQEGAPVAAAPTAPAPKVTPAHDLVTPPPAPAPVKTYNVSGNEYTGEQLLNAGWTQAQIDAL